MINLVPPELKQSIRYGRRNAMMVHYIKLTVGVFGILAVALVGGRLYLDHQAAVTKAATAQKNRQIASYATQVSGAKSLNTRLSAISSIQKSQAKFSELLSDLAQYMPNGTAVTSLTLTGNYQQPVQLTVLANSYQTALGFRDSIARSPRISAADIEGIQGTPVTGGPTDYTVTVVFAFNPAGAK